MDSKNSVSKYINGLAEGQMLDRNDNTRPPGKPAPPPGSLPDLRDESLRHHSLTPVRVLEKIRHDITRMLGFEGSIAGQFTPLELKLIHYIERIVRKGQCPSILVQEQDMIEAMLCLRKYFSGESVTLRGQEDAHAVVKMPVFDTLYTYAKDADRLDQQIRAQRLAKTKANHPMEKEEIEKGLQQLRERKDHCLVQFQRIVFSDADSLVSRNAMRRLVLNGKSVSLDELLAFLKKGGRIDHPRGTVPVDPKPTPRSEHAQSSLVLEEDLGTFDQQDATGEIVDWRKVKSGAKAPSANEDDSSTYTFNL